MYMVMCKKEYIYIYIEEIELKELYCSHQREQICVKLDIYIYKYKYIYV